MTTLETFEYPRKKIGKEKVSEKVMSGFLSYLLPVLTALCFAGGAVLVALSCI